jgi:hypothetical protein
MADVFRRSHARIRCDRPVSVFLGATSGRALGAGKLLDISLSGAYLAFTGELQRGTPYRLEIEAPEGVLSLPFRIVREGPRGAKAADARRFGLLFNLSTDQEKSLRRLIDAIRRQPPSEQETRFDRSLRDYWT